MNSTFRKELPIIGIVLLPFIYLAIIWNTLPDKIPTHWNNNGEIDSWGDKFSLIGILFMMPVFMYVLMLIIPKIDSKKRIPLMGGKFYQIKFILVLFMTLMAMYIIFISNHQSFSNPNFIAILIGILFIIMGNYFKVIQPNYFIGIRTPWTLQSDTVWKTTHVLAGKLWFVGGMIIVLGGLLMDVKFFSIAFVAMIFLMVLIPVVYSYIKFKGLEKNV